MHIIHVTTTLDIGGAQIMLRRFLEVACTSCDTHEVISLTPGGRTRFELERLGIEVFDLGMKSPARLPFALRKLSRILRDRKPDVVHGWMYHGCLAAGLTAPRDVPLVMGIHHSLQNPRNERLPTRVMLRMLAPISRRSAAVAYCGHSISEQHEAIGFARDRRVVIPNGIDCDVFHPNAEARGRLVDLAGIPPERVIIGNVTRNHPMKDVGMLVRALNRMVADGVDAHLVLVGEGQPEGPARLAAQVLGLDDRVTTLPARSDMEEIVPGFDIFALCSAWGEAFSLAMGEAMAAGVPSVTTDVGDGRWLLGDPDRIVPPRHDDKMAQVLSALARLSPAERHRLGMRDRDRVVSNFSLRSYAAAHRDMYRQITEPRRVPDTGPAVHSLAGR